MKKLLYTFAALLCIASVSSCKWHEYEEPEDELVSGSLRVTSVELMFEPDGGTNQVTFESNGPVTATTKSAWLTTKVEGGILYLTAEANKSIDPRYATVVLSSGLNSLSVTAQQMGVILSDFSPADITVTSKGGSYEIPFSANTTVILSSSQDFVTPSVTTDSEGKTSIKIEVAVNPTVDARSAVVTYGVGDRTGTINVNQAGAMVQNPNWTITYEGLTKVNKKSHDDILVTVGSGDTGDYTVVVLPAAEYKASGLEHEDFVVTGAAPKADLTILTSATGHFYEAKLANADYVAYAIGLKADGTTTGYWQVLEFSIDREPTPYEKFLGEWTITRGSVTDTWRIVEDVEDESYIIWGIQSIPDDYGLETPAEFDPATNTLTVYEQTFGQWTHPTYGTATDAIYGEFVYSGSTYYSGTTGTVLFKGTLSSDGKSVALAPGAYYGVYTYSAFQYYWVVSAGAGSYLDDEEEPTALPNTLTRK